MTMRQTIAKTALAATLLFGANAACFADGSESESVAPAANRWAFFIDASNDSNAENAAALAEFRDALIASGIPEENAPVYSVSSNDPQKRPTRETIAAIANALRRPDDVVFLPGETEEKRLRNDDGVCEAQVYLTGLGVANEETGETFFAPADVDESEIDGWNDPKLIPLKTLEDALLYAEEGRRPLERTFFIVALNSPAPATRNAFGEFERRLRGFDPQRVPTRGAGNATETSKFAHFRVATKNARFDDRMVGSFYSTLRDGLSGCADVAGDQNGTVCADELATYLETNARGAGKTVAVVRGGNDRYPLCATQKKPSIPTELFDEIAKTFTAPQYKKDRDGAAARAKKAREKNGSAKTTEGVIVK